MDMEFWGEIIGNAIIYAIFFVMVVIYEYRYYIRDAFIYIVSILRVNVRCFRWFLKNYKTIAKEMTL